MVLLLITTITITTFFLRRHIVTCEKSVDLMDRRYLLDNLFNYPLLDLRLCLKILILSVKIVHELIDMIPQNFDRLLTDRDLFKNPFHFLMVCLQLVNLK